MVLTLWLTLRPTNLSKRRSSAFIYTRFPRGVSTGAPSPFGWPEKPRASRALSSSGGGCPRSALVGQEVSLPALPTPLDPSELFQEEIPLDRGVDILREVAQHDSDRFDDARLGDRGGTSCAPSALGYSERWRGIRSRAVSLGFGAAPATRL